MKLQEIAKLLNSSKSVAIMGHADGDNDCYGASFALASALCDLGKNAKVVIAEDFPDLSNFLFFYYSGDIVKSVEKTDVLVILDSSDISRVSDPNVARNLIKSGAKVIQIDHHVAGDLSKIADISLSDTHASSASEITFKLLCEMKVPINKNIATCLLAGIVVDTNSFQNQNTTEESFAIASELMKYGARLASIVNHTFGGKKVDVLKVWGLAMERLKIDKNHSIVSTYLTNNDIISFGLSADAVTGIINFLNSIKGAKVVLLMTEEEKGTIKVSMRTRDREVNVANIAKQLGGGGHINAAGFSFPGSLKTLTEGDKSHIVIV